MAIFAVFAQHVEDRPCCRHLMCLQWGNGAMEMRVPHSLVFFAVLPQRMLTFILITRSH